VRSSVSVSSPFSFSFLSSSLTPPECGSMVVRLTLPLDKRTGLVQPSGHGVHLDTQGRDSPIVDNVGRGKDEPGVGLDGEDDSSVNVKESGLSVGDLVIGDHVGIERNSNLIGVGKEGSGEGSEVAERVGRRGSFK